MATTATVYRRLDKLRLYRQLLKNASLFPMRSRRELVTEEVRSCFRNPSNDSLTNDEIDYKLVVGGERARAIGTYARNMYWFHSRDEVTREMLLFSQARDRKLALDMAHYKNVGDAQQKTDEVTRYWSALYHVHPDYYHKIDCQPLTHPRDVWRARGQYPSDVGGPRQKFYVRRFKAAFPQGW